MTGTTQQLPVGYLFKPPGSSTLQFSTSNLSAYYESCTPVYVRSDAHRIAELEALLHDQVDPFDGLMYHEIQRDYSTNIADRIASIRLVLSGGQQVEAG